MPDTKLLFGPYLPPRVRRGQILVCEFRGEVVKVGGLTDAPIMWPRVLKTGSPSVIVCGDLVRAIRTESAAAVAYHWGVSETTVWKWRKSLGVEAHDRGDETVVSGLDADTTAGREGGTRKTTRRHPRHPEETFGDAQRETSAPPNPEGASSRRKTKVEQGKRVCFASWSGGLASGRALFQSLPSLKTHGPRRSWLCSA